ncbi:MAG: helix-turn-helix transcriptional regulator [Melioribacteraceae bacterium]
MKAKIKSTVEKNFTDPNFDVNKLAELLGICRNYLYISCQFELDCSPHEYIEFFRIQKSKELLLNGFKIIEVCKKSGYSNKKTFYSAFKRQLNITPIEFFRKNALIIISSNLLLKIFMLQIYTPF